METYRAKPAKKPQNTGKTQSKAKKNSLSPEEMKKRESAKKAAAQKAREEKKRLAALKRKRRKQLFRLCFSLALIFVVLYWCYVAFAISTRVKAEEEILPLMIFTEGKRTEDLTLKPEEILLEGKSYLAVTKLSDYMTVSQFGDNKTRSFQLKNGQWATFHLGSEEAVINGVHVSLSAPARVVDGELCLPVDFFGTKMTSFDFSAAVSTYGADVLTAKEVEPSFYFHTSPQSGTVSYDTVPVAPTLPTPEAPVQ